MSRHSEARQELLFASSARSRILRASNELREARNDLKRALACSEGQPAELRAAIATAIARVDMAGKLSMETNDILMALPG